MSRQGYFLLGKILPVSFDEYAPAEIVAEKLRDLLQSRKHLAERGWGASRACRDYYDLWSVLRRDTRKNRVQAGRRGRSAENSEVLRSLRGLVFLFSLPGGT